MHWRGLAEQKTGLALHCRGVASHSRGLPLHCRGLAVHYTGLVLHRRGLVGCSIYKPSHESHQVEVWLFWVREKHIRIVTRNHSGYIVLCTKDDPWHGCVSEGLGCIKRNCAWGSCRNVSIVLEYRLCTILEFMRVCYIIVQLDPGGPQGTPCRTKWCGQQIPDGILHPVLIQLISAAITIVLIHGILKYKEICI